MVGFVEMMAAPVAVALVLLAMHGYLGAHVVRRGVIFVDIALAQMAAFGVAVAMWLGAEVGTSQTFLAGLASTLVGALLLSFTRSAEERVPQEAYIGIIYAVFSSAMILVLSQLAHGGEEINNLMVGKILWVTWTDVLKTALLYGVLGILLTRWHRPLLKISTNPVAAQAEGLSLRRWDFLFYMVLGIVVTISVQIAGVLLVFTLLVVPTVMAFRWIRGARRQFAYILGIGTVAAVGGSALSYGMDLPTGAAIVCTFGLLLALQIVFESMKRGRAET
jgi:zinc/manganese transport system permease protein